MIVDDGWMVGDNQAIAAVNLVAAPVVMAFVTFASGQYNPNAQQFHAIMQRGLAGTGQSNL